MAENVIGPRVSKERFFTDLIDHSYKDFAGIKEAVAAGDIATCEKIFADAKARGLDMKIELIGDRPCMGGVDLSKIERLTEICRPIIEDVVGIKVKTHSSSTDCNIPLSLGVPALCIGVWNGGGFHTREEWLERDSIIYGLEVGIKAIMEVSKEV